ncbi:MAG: MFS transporter, partial [Bauldia litoralis]
HGWRVYMYALAGGALVMATLTWMFTRDRSSPDIAAGVRAEGALRSLVRVARRPQTLLIALFILLVSGPLLAFGGLWGVPFTMALYGVDKPTAGFAVSLGLIGVAAGGPVWGWVSDRVGRRKPPIVAGSLIAALSLGVALYLPGLPFDLYRLLMFLYGFGGSAMIIAYALGREHNADGGVGGALGLINMCAVLSGAIFQPLIGIVLDWRWDGTMQAGARVYSLDAYADAFLVLPALYGVGVLIALAIRETRCRPVAVAP